MKIIDCNFDQHGEKILSIFNHAIAHSTAIYAYENYSLEFIKEWFEGKAEIGYPVLGAIEGNGSNELLGFASYGSFRSKPAYKYVVEHSVYIDKDHQGKGLGKLLLTALVERAKLQQYHSLIGAVDADNASSIAMHEKLGFTKAGTLSEVGFKFDRWLDLSLYQLVLSTPKSPVDG